MVVGWLGGMRGSFRGRENFATFAFFAAKKKTRLAAVRVVSGDFCAI